MNNITVLYLLKNYHQLKHKYNAGNLEGNIELPFKTLMNIFKDEEILTYKNGAIQVIILHFVKGLTWEAIAERMQIGISTVYLYRKWQLEKLAEVLNIPIE
ncbi:MAG: hypothetical protein MJ172_04585 [Clostridia bacterium]|nr:hypothetical protein [Clostridia bacterium]